MTLDCYNLLVEILLDMYRRNGIENKLDSFVEYLHWDLSIYPVARLNFS